MRFRSFQAHCERMGIELLADDYKLIDAQLNKFHQSQYKSILEVYLQKWYEGTGYAEKASQHQNLGRNYANKWLREEGEAQMMKTEEN